MGFQYVRRETVGMLLPVAALSGAGGAALGDIVYTEVDLPLIEITTPVDMNGDGVADFSLGLFWESLSVYDSAGIAYLTPSGQFALPEATPVGPSLGWLSLLGGGGHYLYETHQDSGKGDGDPTGPWTEGEWADGAHLLGVRFEIDGATHYGWALIGWEYLYGYAYETTPGMAIPAGATPSPGALAVLAMGAVGVLKRTGRGGGSRARGLKESI
jgi:hypothetical protein